MRPRNALAPSQEIAPRLPTPSGWMLGLWAPRAWAMILVTAAVGSAALPINARAQMSYSSSDGSYPPRHEGSRQQERSPSRWAPGAWTPWNETARTDRADAPSSGANSTRAPVTAPQVMPPQVRPHELLQRADANLAAGRHDDAIAALEQIIEQYPTSRESTVAKDRLIAQFRMARQQQGGQQAVQDVKPRDLSALKSAPQEIKAPPAPPAGPVAWSSPAVQPASAGTFSAALRRGGDDFKLSVGDRIFFDAATAKIDARQRNVLHAQAAWLKDRPEAVIKIEGHADDPGPRELNAMLALERAEAVRAILIHEGVSTDRIEVIAAGNTRPVAICSPVANASELCSSQNRRVVTQVEWIDAGYRRRLSSVSSARHSAANGPSIGPHRHEADEARTAIVRAPQPARAPQ
jgi:peptidoglycan-associated lipoprotein